VAGRWRRSSWAAAFWPWLCCRCRTAASR
jgi:hypothetical protein